MDVITCVAPNLRTIPHNRVNPNTGKKADISYQELKNCTGVEIQRILRWRLQIRQRYCFWEHSDVKPFGPPPEIFDVIEYAVYHTGCETANYEAFRDARGRFL